MLNATKQTKHGAAHVVTVKPPVWTPTTEANSVTPAQQADTLNLELDVEELVFHAILPRRVDNFVNLDAGFPERGDTKDDSSNVSHDRALP
jgi:hypothetical protein